VGLILDAIRLMLGADKGVRTPTESYRGGRMNHSGDHRGTLSNVRSGLARDPRPPARTPRTRSDRRRSTPTEISHRPHSCLGGRLGTEPVVVALAGGWAFGLRGRPVGFRLTEINGAGRPDGIVGLWPFCH